MGRACGNDTALRQHVERLLAADAKRGAIFYDITPASGEASQSQQSDFDTVQLTLSTGLIACRPRLSSDVQLYWADHAGRRLRTVSSPRSLELGADLSPDEQRVVFAAPATEATGDSDLYALEMDTDTVTRLTPERGSELTPVWSPDGRQVAFVAVDDEGYSIWTVDVVTGSRECIRPAARARTLLTQWTPRGTSVVYQQPPFALRSASRRASDR